MADLLVTATDFFLDTGELSVSNSGSDLPDGSEASPIEGFLG